MISKVSTHTLWIQTYLGKQFWQSWSALSMNGLILMVKHSLVSRLLIINYYELNSVI